MKILLLAPQPFFQNRGTPVAVKLLSETLANQGHRVHMLTYHEGENLKIPNVMIHRIPVLPGLANIKPGFSWRKVLCDIVMFGICLKMIRKKRFDLVHAVEESVFIAMFIRAFFRIPYVYDMDSCLSQQLIHEKKYFGKIQGLLELLEKIAVRRSLGVIAVCKALENIAADYDPQKIVQRLEDISLLNCETYECEILRETLRTSDPIIMYIGNLEKYQGIDLLLEGFECLSEKGLEAQLVVIGGRPRDIQTYKERSLQLAAAKRIHFIGPRPISQLGSYLSQADILVSPRIQGANTPMKIYSYLDSGKPVLATRLGTHTQVLDDKISMLVKPEPKAMADGLALLIEDQELAKKIATQAKKRVQEEFCYEAFQRKLLAFYESLNNLVLTERKNY